LQLLPLYVARQVTYHVDEEASVGTFVGNIVTDARLTDVYPDGVLGQLRFRFLRRQVDELSVDSVTGIVTTSARLDREALCGATASAAAAGAAAAAAGAVAGGGGSCLLRMDVVVQPMQFLRIIRVLVYVQDINDNAPR